MKKIQNFLLKKGQCTLLMCQLLGSSFISLPTSHCPLKPATGSQRTLIRNLSLKSCNKVINLHELECILKVVSLWNLKHYQQISTAFHQCVLTLQENIFRAWILIMCACPHLTDQTTVSYTFVIVWKSHGLCQSAKAWSGTTDRSTRQSYYSYTSSKHQRRKLWKNIEKRHRCSPPRSSGFGST